MPAKCPDIILYPVNGVDQSDQYMFDYSDVSYGNTHSQGETVSITCRKGAGTNSHTTVEGFDQVSWQQTYKCCKLSKENRLRRLLRRQDWLQLVQMLAVHALLGQSQDESFNLLIADNLECFKTNQCTKYLFSNFCVQSNKTVN